MKINFTNLAAVTIIGGLVAFMIVDNKRDGARIAQIDAKLDSLETVISIKDTAINKLTVKINLLNDSIAQTDVRLDNYKSQLKNLKDQYGKIKPTNNASAADVSDFFSERYSK
jgi:predicted  nucleic acid-binding Zn-ribbon protein